MTMVVRGQKLDLPDRVLVVTLTGGGWAAQALDRDGQVLGQVAGLQRQGADGFRLDLLALAPVVERVRFLASPPVDGVCTVAADREPVASYSFAAADAAGAAVLVVAEVYRRQGTWRFGAVGQGLLGAVAPGAVGEGLPREVASASVRILRAGERLALPSSKLRVELLATGTGARLVCLGLDQDGKLAGDNCYLLADGAAPLPGYQRPAGVEPGLAFDLAATPERVARWAIAALTDSASSGVRPAPSHPLDAPASSARLELSHLEGPLATYEVSTTPGHALLVGEIYWKGGWRFAALGEAVAGGIAGLFAAHGDQALGQRLRNALDRASSPMLVRGQKEALPPDRSQYTVRVELEARAREAFEVVALALDGLGRLPDDASFLHAGRKQLPGGGLTAIGSLLGHQATFTLDLARLPGHVQRIVLALVAVPPANAAQLVRGAFALEAAGQVAARFDFAGQSIGPATAAVVAEIYRKDGGWRVFAAAEAVDGGLPALLTRAGRPWLLPTRQPAPPRFLALEASGASVSLDLHRGDAGRPLRLELAWELAAGRRGLLGLAARPTPLELGCMYVLASGHRGVLQREPGEAARPPFMTLEARQLVLHRPDELAFALVFATTAGDLAEVAPALKVVDQRGGEVDLAFGPAPAAGRRFLALATLEAIQGELVVTRTGSWLEDAVAADAAIALPDLSFVPRRQR